PLAFWIGILSLIFGILVWGDRVGYLLYIRVVDGVLLGYQFLAAPMFVFMGMMLQRSGIAERMYDALYLWLGGIRGGLAVVTILIGTIMAASVGIIAASITCLALVALPSMVGRGYDKSLAAGSICAGGSLGILIPPSNMLVFYGPMAGISVGKLFFGAFGPGLLLSVLYQLYILVRSLIQPNIAPAVSAEEISVSLFRKTHLLITSLFPPAILIMAVLGTIFFGIAPPTEAASVGALCSILLVAAYRRLSWKVLFETSRAVLIYVGWIFFIIAMAMAFTGVFFGAEADEVVSKMVLATPGGKWGAFLAVMFICFVLGFVADWHAIVFIMVPIISPMVETMGFDPLWFAIMICVNLQMSFMTPPMAYAIFIIRGAAPEEVGL
ncbi:MAG: TRAP transporter large permease subunit, partial [Dehalococcoidia bacterium]